MAQLTVRNLAPEVVGALERRAAAHGRSAGAEHRDILRKALLDDAVDAPRTAPVAVPHPMRRLAAAAARLALDLHHPVCDCFYLALAVPEQYRVVTADGRCPDKVRRHPYLSDRIVHGTQMA